MNAVYSGIGMACKYTPANQYAEISEIPLIKTTFGGWPHGLVLKFDMLLFSIPGMLPGHGPTLFIGSHAIVATHIQKRGRLAQMLAQGKSSSSKKRKIGNRC